MTKFHHVAEIFSMRGLSYFHFNSRDCDISAMTFETSKYWLFPHLEGCIQNLCLHLKGTNAMHCLCHRTELFIHQMGSESYYFLNLIDCFT